MPALKPTLPTVYERWFPCDLRAEGTSPIPFVSAGLLNLAIFIESIKPMSFVSAGSSSYHSTVAIYKPVHQTLARRECSLLENL